MSPFTQKSFHGGMNLRFDDTRVPADSYVVGFNLRNRDDRLDSVLESQLDVAAPSGIKQAILTFGNYIILFCAGKAYYRYYLNTGWIQIDGFSMQRDAPRYWFAVVPVTTTNYARLGTLAFNPAGAASSVINPQNPVILSNSIIAAAQGNNPGLLVQDNINQPQFIFIGPAGFPICRTTQSYNQWSITIDATTLLVTEDKREYVPVGNTMAWCDGVLYVASTDGNYIYRSVSGRPLDFVIAVDNNGGKSGDATSTSYSVGVGGISCLKELSDGSLFVAASSANFQVSKNKTPEAPKIYGEYELNRKFLFNATCLSDRVIIDTLGDTRFIDLTGVRSWNAILQQQNEGKNSVFTSIIQKALTKLPSDSVDLVQNPLYSAAILYDNYELYALNTIFGPSIAVFDSIQNCWSSFDTLQTNNKRIKQFAKIESTIQRLYAITEDDRLYALYIGPNTTLATVRPPSVTAENTPVTELKPTIFRAIVNNIRQNITVTATPFVNNRLTVQGGQSKNVTYRPPAAAYVSDLVLPDINTQLSNLMFTFANTGQGWKSFVLLSWSGGSIVQYSLEYTENTPMNPPLSQGTI